jgi:heme-degrading monooxygenase HmoA
MFVAMNVFTCEDDASAKNLEAMFLRRSGLVDRQPGFVSFAFLRGVENSKKLISMTHWRSKEDFEAWTRSEAFEKGHSRAKEASEKTGRPPAHGPMKLTNALETYEVVSSCAARTA